jgi:hypothetical protein
MFASPRHNAHEATVATTASVVESTAVTASSAASTCSHSDCSCLSAASSPSFGALAFDVVEFGSCLGMLPLELPQQEQTAQTVPQHINVITAPPAKTQHKKQQTTAPMLLKTDEEEAAAAAASKGGDDELLYSIGTLSLSARRRKIAKFLRKRGERVWTKRTIYKSRETHANTRPRVGGRFVAMTNTVGHQKKILALAKKKAKLAKRAKLAKQLAKQQQQQQQKKAAAAAAKKRAGGLSAQAA